MGSTPAAGDGRRAGAGRPAGHRGGRRRGGCGTAADGTTPPSDLNGDADYRRHLATVLTRRAVLAAAEGAERPPMELTHSFTVPSSVDDDLGALPGHRRARRVLPGRPGHLGRADRRRRTDLRGHLQGQARADRAGVRRVRAASSSATRPRTASWSRPRVATSAATAPPARPSPLTMEAAGDGTTVEVADRPVDHRQAGPVRPRRDAGRVGQAPRAVRRLPGAAARGDGAADGDGSRPPHAADSATGPIGARPGHRTRCRRRGNPPDPRRIRTRRTARWTSALLCSRCSPSRTAVRSLPPLPA